MRSAKFPHRVTLLSKRNQPTIWQRPGPRHNGGVTRNADADWTGYYAWSSGRQPRPLLLAACEQLGDGAGRMAVDLGCGDGTDALALLERGWSVQAVEVHQAGLAILRARVPDACAERIRLVCGSFADIALPSAHLIHAGFSLPFCSPSQFPGVWEKIRRALAPGGIFAGQLFGTHDSWASNLGMTFQDRSTVTRPRGV